MTGIYIDSKGNWKVVINIPAEIKIEKSPGEWESVRNLYISFVAKFKLQIKDEKVEFTPKSIEI